MQTNQHTVRAQYSASARATRGLPCMVRPGHLVRFAGLGGLLAALLLAVQIGAPVVAAQIATQPGPDGTPQFDRTIERRTYLKAGPDEILTYMFLVYAEAKKLPA